MAEAPFVPDPSGFGERLARRNGLIEAGFAAWEFLPGMRFAERAAWWRAGAERPGAHEGLDICWYLTSDGALRSLGAGARVPVLWAGEIVSSVEDFLGVSLFVAHERRDDRGRQLHSIYGHIRPRPGLVPGSRVGGADEVGAIADPCRNGRAVPPHLHLTLALIDRAGAADRLDWDALRESNRVVLLDPMPTLK